MPMSRTYGRKARFTKTGPQIGQLVLISGRDVEIEAQHEQTSYRHTKSQLQLDKQITILEEDGLGQLTNDILDHQTTALSQLSDNISIVSEIQTTKTISSPLVRKQSAIRKVRFQEADATASEGHPSPLSATALSLEETPELVTMASKNAVEMNAWRFKPNTSWNTPVPNVDDDLETFQELAVVSVRKRLDSSDSDESSDDGPYTDDEEHSERYYSRLETEPVITLALDSGDEGDVEMEDNVGIYRSLIESRREESDEIEDDSDEILSHIRQEHEQAAKIPRNSDSLPESVGSWRSHRPKPSRVAMEVDDDIVDSPETPCSLRVPSLAKKALLGTSIPIGNIYHSQDSMDLGDTNKLMRRTSEIPETQMDDVQTDGEKGDSFQYTFAPESNYFTRASQQLEASAPCASLIRGNSMPSNMRNYLPEHADAFMSGRVTDSQFSSHSTSRPERNSGSTLSRHSSVPFGHATSCSNPRIASLPINPPFK